MVLILILVRRDHERDASVCAEARTSPEQDILEKMEMLEKFTRAATTDDEVIKHVATHHARRLRSELLASIPEAR